MSYELELVKALRQNGFERKVYCDQVGEPVFFSRTFEPEECPSFMESLESDFGAAPGEIDPGVITVEISENGTLLQHACTEVDYWASCDPRSDGDTARMMLDEFGISTNR